MTRFFIEVDGVTIAGEGVVTVTGAPDADPGPSITAFLAAVDPVLIERQAMERQGWGDKSLAAAIIEVLAEFAAGKT